MVHIGNGVSIFKENIVAILSTNTVLESIDTKLFIDSLIDMGSFVNNSNNDIKSYILCLENQRINLKDKSRYKVYLSNISSETIIKRINMYGQDWRKINEQ